MKTSTPKAKKKASFGLFCGKTYSLDINARKIDAMDVLRFFAALPRRSAAEQRYISMPTTGRPSSTEAPWGDALICAVRSFPAE